MLSSSPSKIHEPLVTGVSPRPTDRRQHRKLRNTSTPVGSENRVTRPDTDQRFVVGLWVPNSAVVAELRLRRHVSVFVEPTGDLGHPGQCPVLTP